MKIIPAIDIKNGKVVRLLKGNFDNEIIYSTDVISVVDKLISLNSKRIHIVDLDGSKIGKPQIYDIVKSVRNRYPQLEIEVGGGIRTEHDIKRYVELDCDIILGTYLINDIQSVKLLVEKYKKRIIAGLDCVNGIPKIDGWTKSSDRSLYKLLDDIKDIGINKIIYTNILKDGTLTGIDIGEYQKLKNNYSSLEFVVSGGISSNEDILTCIKNEFDCIVGKAFYENKVNIGKLQNTAFINSLKYDIKGLIPAIVQDYQTNEVLMLAYMDKDSLKLTLENKKMTYYSRSKQSLWVKGETSGNIQYVESVSYDCDKDTLLFKVSQVGVACHTGHASCFYRSHNLYTEVKKDIEINNPGNVLQELYSIIKAHKGDIDAKSYSSYLLSMGIEKIVKKVGEETIEFLIASMQDDKENLINEISDATYHILLLMVFKDISLEDITNCLNKRSK